MQLGNSNNSQGQRTDRGQALRSHFIAARTRPQTIIAGKQIKYTSKTDLHIIG